MTTEAAKTWQPGDVITIDHYPKMVKEFFTSPDGNEILWAEQIDEETGKAVQSDRAAYNLKVVELDKNSGHPMGDKGTWTANTLEEAAEMVHVFDNLLGGPYRIIVWTEC